MTASHSNHPMANPLSRSLRKEHREPHIALSEGPASQLSPIQPDAASMPLSSTTMTVGSSASIESTMQEWESKIMDRVSRMSISTEAPTSCTASRENERVGAAEVSFSADDLAGFTGTTQAQERVLLTPARPTMKPSPVRRRIKRKSSLVSTPRQSFVATPIRAPPPAGEAMTPQISNLHPRRHKKARHLNPSSPVPLYLRQPCFSPCASAYDQLLARPTKHETASNEGSTPLFIHQMLDSSISKQVSPICASGECGLNIDWINPLPSCRQKTDRRRRRLLRMRNIKPCGSFPFSPLSPCPSVTTSPSLPEF